MKFLGFLLDFPRGAQAYFRTFLYCWGLGRSKLYFLNDIEPRGVIFPKYEPVASHGDPIQAGFSKISTILFEDVLPKYQTKTIFDYS